MVSSISIPFFMTRQFTKIDLLREKTAIAEDNAMIRIVTGLVPQS